MDPSNENLSEGSEARYQDAQPVDYQDAEALQNFNEPEQKEHHQVSFENRESESPQVIFENPIPQTYQYPEQEVFENANRINTEESKNNIRKLDDIVNKSQGKYYSNPVEYATTEFKQVRREEIPVSQTVKNEYQIKVISSEPKESEPDPMHIASHLRNLQDKVDSILRKSRIEDGKASSSSGIKPSGYSSNLGTTTQDYRKDVSYYLSPEARISTDKSVSQPRARYTNSIYVEDDFRQSFTGEAPKRSSQPVKSEAANQSGIYSHLSPQIGRRNISDVGLNSYSTGPGRSWNINATSTTTDLLAGALASNYRSQEPPKKDYYDLTANLRNSEIRLDQIIEGIRLKNSSVGYNSNYNSEQPNNQYKSSQPTIVRKEYSPNPVSEPLKNSAAHQHTFSYSAVNIDPMQKDREKRSSSPEANSILAQNAWYNSGVRSRHVSNSSISNTHVPLKLKSDSNTAVEQSERVMSKDEGREYIQRYYIPDPTVKEKANTDNGNVRTLQANPQRLYGTQNPNEFGLAPVETQKKANVGGDIVRNEEAFFCNDLEDDNTPTAQKKLQGVQVVHEKEVFGGSGARNSHSNNRRKQRHAPQSKEFEIRNGGPTHVDKVQEAVERRESNSSARDRGFGFGIKDFSVDKFFERESEIEDFAFE